MLGINAVPALGNRQIRSAKELPCVAKDDLVDLFFVENVYGQRVFVRVAEGECSIRSLRYQRVNSPAVVLGGLFGDAPAERRERAANLKSWIEAQREPGRQRRTELPSMGLRGGAHHLQFASGQTTRGIVLRIEGFEIVAAANNHGFRLPAPVAGMQDGRFDRGHRGSKDELDVVLLREKAGQRLDNLTGIDR